MPSPLDPTDLGTPVADGYRKQTVTVNGRVHGGTGEAAGVFLAGGGRVFIGPQGSVGAESGIAILAAGDTPAEMEGDPALKPKLYLDITLAGRRVAQVFGDDYILNDGGETTIVVNGVVLHHGATGVTGATAPQRGVERSDERGRRHRGSHGPGELGYRVPTTFV